MKKHDHFHIWSTYLKRLALLTASLLLCTVAGISQTTFSDIQAMSGITSCSSCAGKGGAGPAATFSMKQNIVTPSLDGKAAQFSIGGSTPYSDAMWTKKLPISSANLRHFVFDTFYYIENPGAIQGLEFNITNYSSSKGYTFGVTCDVRSSGTWKISVPNGSNSSMGQMHWQSTGISCPAPTPFQWNRVTFEAERTSDNKVRFVSLTVNGKKSYLNTTVYARRCPSGWGGVTTHIQLNGNVNQESYSLWADKYNVQLW
jgi:hypothetical protein